MPTAYLNAQAEIINQKLPDWFGHMKGPWYNELQKLEVENVGERDYRMPYIKTDGGHFGTYNPDGGTLGTGSSGDTGVGVGAYFPFRFNMQLTELQMKATADRKVSQLNAFKRAIKSAMPNFMAHLDQAYHGDGTAVLATATAHSSGSGTSVYTMDTVTGLKWLRVGQPVVPYLNDLSAARASGAQRIITKLNYATREVTLDATVTSAGATDKLCFAGVSGANPIGPTGLAYFNNPASIGTTWGINRANEPQIVPEVVAVDGAPTVQKILQLQAQYQERFKELPEWKGFMSIQSVVHFYNQVFGLGQVSLLGGAQMSKDLLPEGFKNKLTLCGTSHWVDAHHVTDKINYVDFRWAGRVRLPNGQLQFWASPDGQKFFIIPDTTTGTPTAKVWMAWTCHENVIHTKPGSGGILTGVSLGVY